MSTSSRIRWLRVVIGGVLVELALFAVAICAYVLPDGAALLIYIVPPICLIAAFLGGFWAARNARERFVLHGALVGAVAAILYAAMTWRTALPAIYVVSNGLKPVGGAAGGLLAQQKSAVPHTE